MTESFILSEMQALPETVKLEVLRFVQFLKKEHQEKTKASRPKERVFGRSKGRYQLAADFDEPLEDFKDYM